jgi:3-dehydroquinate synthase
MVLACRLSARLGHLSEADVGRVEALVSRAGLPIAAPEIPVDEFVELMRRDKKVVCGELRFVLLRGLGEAWVAPVDEAAARAALAIG